MKLEGVKINPHTRVKILCSFCDVFIHEVETYADLDTRFRYICFSCVGQLMLREGKHEIIDKVAKCG